METNHIVSKTIAKYKESYTYQYIGSVLVDSYSERLFSWLLEYANSWFPESEDLKHIVCQICGWTTLNPWSPYNEDSLEWDRGEFGELYDSSVYQLSSEQLRSHITNIHSAEYTMLVLGTM